MKKYTDEEISEIRENLNKGVTYCGIDIYGRGVGTIFAGFPTIWIHYSHYGSSAVKNTNKKLRWLIETIFKDCEIVTPAEWSDYHVNYIPIDKRYKGIDCSADHPNSYGL